MLARRDNNFNRVVYELLPPEDQTRVQEASFVSPGRKQQSMNRDQWIDAVKGLAALYYDGSTSIKLQPEAGEKCWNAYKDSRWYPLCPVLPNTFGQTAVQHSVGVALSKTAVKFGKGKQQVKRAHLKAIQAMKQEEGEDAENELVLSLVLFVCLSISVNLCCTYVYRRMEPIAATPREDRARPATDHYP
jgi:rubredoxin